MKKKNRNILNYILVYLLIAESSIPLFMNKSFNIIIFIISASIFFYLNPPPYKFSKSLVIFFFSLIGVLIMQLAFFGPIYLLTFVLQIMLFFTAYFIIKVVRENYLRIYLNILFILSTISIVIYFSVVSYPTYFELLVNFIPSIFTLHPADNVVHYNVLFYHFIPDLFSKMRNNGPFWEPGVFGGLLMLGIVFETIIRGKLFTAKNLIFIVSLITTYSTTSYIALFIFIVGFSYLTKKNILTLTIIAPLLLVLFYSLYTNIPFLRDKVNNEIENTESDALEQGGNTRTASAYLDIKELVETPYYIIFGRGSHPGLRVEGTQYSYRRNNGFTDLLSRWGLLFSIIYLFYIIRSLFRLTDYYNQSKYMTLLSFLVIIILSQSEPYFRYPLFISLVFIFYIRFDSVQDSTPTH